MPQPNLFIGGPPKCGTSTLFNWLNKHPDICGSDPKETFFLMDPENPLCNKKLNYHIQGWQGYENFLKDQAKKYVMDGTTHLLFQNTAIQEIEKLDGHVIFILRSPAERIRSSFYYTLNNLSAIQESYIFAQYVEDLLSGNVDRISKNVIEEKSQYVLIRDLEYSNYAEYLNKWANAIDESRLIVLQFEKFFEEPEAQLRILCEKLEIDPDAIEDLGLEGKNKTLEIKNKGLHRGLLNLRRKFKSMPVPGIAKDLYIRYFTQTPENAQDEASIKLLKNFFKPHTEKLKEMYNIDLTYWD